MAKSIFTATDPNGVEHKRATKRAYTHTVVFLPSFEAAMKDATSAGYTKSDTSNYDYYVACAAGTHEHVTRITPAGGFHASYTAEKIEQHQAWQREQNAKLRAYGKEATDGLTRDEYVAKLRANRVAGVEKSNAEGYFRKYQNAGWCGRLDLAQKLAASLTRAARTEILPATLKA